jgi:cytochrome P450
MATAARIEPLDLDVGRSDIWRENRWEPLMDRLRAEAPVSYCPDSAYGAYWSVVRYDDITEVEAHPELYSSASEYGGITIADALGEAELPHFIAMDRPRHTGQRRSVQPAFTPSEIERLSHEIRRRTGALLDTLPVGTEFDWVQRLSIELTTGMLAIIFDFPWEDRAKLTLWSDWSADLEAMIDPVRGAERLGHLNDCAAYFARLWEERAAQPAGKTDLISLMVHNEAMASLSPLERLANIVLLIVGGNDTTRNSMSGAAMAFTQFPGEYAKLLADPALAANAASEVIRWQTPLAHMRRTATEDTVLAGQTIRKGDRVVMWYAAANREEAKFPRARDYVIDRENARRHLSFGFGIHRCVGARLAELQLKILFEELVARRLVPTVSGPVERVNSSFINGYSRMPVTLTRA